MMALPYQLCGHAQLPPGSHMQLTYPHTLCCTQTPSHTQAQESAHTLTPIHSLRLLHRYHYHSHTHSHLLCTRWLLFPESPGSESRTAPSSLFFFTHHPFRDAWPPSAPCLPQVLGCPVGLCRLLCCFPDVLALSRRLHEEPGQVPLNCFWSGTGPSGRRTVGYQGTSPGERCGLNDLNKFTYSDYCSSGR